MKAVLWLRAEAHADVHRREALLSAARDAIEAAVLGRSPRPVVAEATPALLRHAASFVTLRKLDGALRGCIGELEAHRPLIDSVRACAVGAALRDPRFPPVTRDELEAVRIGISVLTAPEEVRAPAGIEVGRHGLLVQRGERRGVLLPEVAPEQGWDTDAFLAQTCRKAGLPAEAWRDLGTRVSVFETIKLAE